MVNFKLSFELSVFKKFMLSAFRVCSVPSLPLSLAHLHFVNFASWFLSNLNLSHKLQRKKSWLYQYIIDETLECRLLPNMVRLMVHFQLQHRNRREGKRTKDNKLNEKTIHACNLRPQSSLQEDKLYQFLESLVLHFFHVVVKNFKSSPFLFSAVSLIYKGCCIDLLVLIKTFFAL